LNSKWHSLGTDFRLLNSPGDLVSVSQLCFADIVTCIFAFLNLRDWNDTAGVESEVKDHVVVVHGSQIIYVLCLESAVILAR